MKTIYRFTSVVALICVLASCNGFLKESSQDEIRPNNVSDYKELIAGEIYSKVNNQRIHDYLDIMTDDCEEFARSARFGSDTRNTGYGYFTWQQSPELQVTGALNSDEAWAFYYHQILVTNMILYDVDDLSGTAQEKAAVKAEAHIIRAYAYYMLVNLYGEPYDPATASSAAGVPLNDLVGAENKKFHRESVQTVYDQIMADGKEALRQFGICGGAQSIFRWNETAANIFMSRVCLYMRNWEDAASYASAALEQKADLWNLEQKEAEGDGSDDGYFFSTRNPEILFTFGYYYIPYFATGAKGAYPASQSLRDMYSKGDLRGGKNGSYIRYLGSTLFGGGKRYCPYKSSDASLTTGRHGNAIRTAEAYLNRAEAYSQMPDKYSEAMKDIEVIRRNRFTAASYEPLAAASQEEVIRAVRDERRRELCFEQQRWFDLRRWDRPSISHRYTPDLNDLSVYETYVLQENDPAYTLPVPKEVIEADSDLEDIDRPARRPVTE